MQVISETAAFIKINKNPKKYPLMVLNPNTDPVELHRIEKDCHVFDVTYNHEHHKGLLPNYTKREIKIQDNSKIKKLKKTYEGITQIFDKIIETKHVTLMLFMPNLPSELKRIQLNRYVTRRIRHEGRMRSGVVCAYLKPKEISVNDELVIVGTKRR